MTNDEILIALLGALDRQGTELDGNWGHPESRSEYRRLLSELLNRQRAETPSGGSGA